MGRIRIVHIVMPLLAVQLSGCATASKVWARLTGNAAPAIEVQVADTGAYQTVATIDRLYSQATAAVEKRDYARAMDLLQLARHENPDDVRVLNALGVIYDKLGRFDLSARYYYRALQMDPGSPIVLANMEYSSLLQGQTFVAPDVMFAQAPTAVSVAAAPVPAGPVDQLSASVSIGAQIAVAEPLVTPQRLQPALLGGPLRIVNASGRTGGQRAVATYLADAGWTVAESAPLGPVRVQSEIRYAESKRGVAQALERTLPFTVVMKSCGDECSGVELIIGMNARTEGRA